jgi:Carboxypeptidase regulatory-like domain
MLRHLRRMVMGVLVLGALAPASALANASFTGTVTSSATGSGLGGVTVNYYSGGASSPFVYESTAPNGTYTSPLLTPGTYDVQFDGSSQGYGQSGLIQVVVSGTTATPATVNGSLTPDSVSGSVVDQRNSLPVSGVTVALVNNASQQVAQTTTDGNGAYSFSVIAPGAGYTVKASQPPNTAFSGGVSSSFTVSAGHATTGVIVPLTSDSVSGTVLDPVTEQGIPNLEVDLLNSSSQEVDQTTSDAHGNYSFGGITPGTNYTVRFNPAGESDGYNTATSSPFTVTAGQATPGINGELFRAAAVSGRVLDPSGQGAQGVTVTVEDTAGHTYTTTTGSDGRYELEGVPTGSYQIEFIPPFGQSYLYQWYPGKSGRPEAAEVSLTAGQLTSGLDATLASGGTISGTVIGRGAPLSGVQVDVYEEGGTPVFDDTEPTEVTTGTDGTYSFTGLPSGNYEIQFSAPAGTDYVNQYYNGIAGTYEDGAPTPVVVRAGATTSHIDATLVSGGEVTGMVTDPSGRPVPGANITVYDDGGQQYGNATTGQDGTYTVMGLPITGSYRVFVQAPSGSTLASEYYAHGSTLATATPVPVTVGQTTANVDATLAQGGSISGTVLDSQGNPVGGAELNLTDSSGNPVDTFVPVQTDGSYEITNLLPGTYKLEFDPEGALAFDFYRGANTLLSATPITVNAGQTTANVNGVQSLGGEVTGTVTSATTGAALANEEVDLVDSAGDLLIETFTDANGQYTITGIPSGTYYVRIPRRTFFFGPTPSSVAYATQYYPGKPTLSGASPVSVSAGATTANINTALVPEAALTPTPPTPPTQNGGNPQNPGVGAQNPPVATTRNVLQTTQQIAPPTISAGSISGLAKKRPTISFKLAAGGTGAHKLTSFTIKLPAGLSFAAGKLKGVSIKGAGRVSESLIGGALVVHLGSPASSISVSVPSSALKISPSLAQKAANRRIASLTVVVPLTRIGTVPATLSFSVKKPH